MINIHSISNLEMFDKEGHSLSCPNDLQEAIQAGIAKKVGKLLNAEGFLALIPDFDPTEDTKLRIHLTKDGITIQLLERNLENSKVDTPYTKKDPELSKEIKTRKEKIITKVDSLFKEPSLDSSARLSSKKIHPLVTPSQPSKDEKVPFTIGFDVTRSNPQIQQLHAKVEALQDQLNKKTPHSEELQVIKEQLQLLSQAIHNLSVKQENITYPHTEEYALINKLVDNQRDIYQALLALLSRNLNQTFGSPQPIQEIENSALKEMLLKLQQEKTDLEQANNLSKQTSQLLAQKEHEVAKLQEKLESLPNLQSQLSDLQREKTDLESEHAKLIEQLNQVKETQAKLSTDNNSKIEELKSSNSVLQANILDKDKQINELGHQIKNSDNTHNELEKQLSQLQQELAILKQSSTLIEKDHREIAQLLEDKTQEVLTLQEKLKELSQLPSQLSDLQREKIDLESEYETLTEQLSQVKEVQTQSDIDYTNKIKQLEGLNTDLQANIFDKEKQIIELDKQIKSADSSHQKLERQLSQLQEELDTLKQFSSLIDKNHKEASQLLVKKEKEIITLQEKLEELSQLPLQLSNLKQEKDSLELEHKNLIEQLAHVKKAQTVLSEGLERSKAFSHTQLSDKDVQITKLNELIKSTEQSYKTAYQALTQKEKEIINLQQKLETLPNLQSQLSDLQREKESLESKLDQANQIHLTLSEQHSDENNRLQTQFSAKDEKISELNTEVKRLLKAYQELEKLLEDEKEITNILNTAAIPETNAKIASIDAIIEKAENKMEQDLSSLEDSIIPKGLLTASSSGYYTITASQEELEPSSEITILQAKINDLLEELEDIRPLAYDSNSKIEKMKKSNKALVVELSEKTKTIQDLEEDKKFLESRLDKSESQLKDLQIAQHTLKEQQKEINFSSEENNDLLEALEKIHEQLSSEKRERAKLEQTYRDQLEELEDLYKEDSLRIKDIISALISDLEQKQPGSCLLLLSSLANYTQLKSITDKEKEDILLLIEPTFRNTNEYKSLTSSDDNSSDEELSSLSTEDYEEDNIFSYETSYQNY